jgi:hypothetical protein
MKTSGSTLGNNGNPLDGVRIGIDIYDGQEDICGTSQTDGSTTGTSHPTFVPWGTSTWTLVTINFIVPKTFSYINQGGSNPEGFANGQQVVPVWMNPWVQALDANDGGEAWFAYPQLYINP